MESVHQPLQTDLQAGETGKKDGKNQRIYETPPQTPYQRLPGQPGPSRSDEGKVASEHATLDPFELKKKH